MKATSGKPLQPIRHVSLLSDYSGFDILLLKRSYQPSLRIPETILLDRSGAPRDWVFNSGKLPGNPILKKRKEHLTPLAVVKALSAKWVTPGILNGIQTIGEVREAVKKVISDQKDGEWVGRKKVLQVTTVEEVMQLSLLDFLEFAAENKLSEQSFYEKWRMIQQRVSVNKIEQSYLVTSIRHNHIIESRVSKFITVDSGNKGVVGFQSQDGFKSVSPSKELVVVETKSVEGYKFFDSFLSKKFYARAAELIEAVQKNYKCIVESLTTCFVIDKNREPHLASIQEIWIRPFSKLLRMREFRQAVLEESIKVDAYVKCLLQFMQEHPQKAGLSLQQPIKEQRRKQCRGQFCEADLRVGGVQRETNRLPLIGGRKIGSDLIEGVRRRRDKVIQKLKQQGVLEKYYNYEEEQSSQYQPSEDEDAKNQRVCENCYIFYLNVLKFYDLDSFKNLIEKKTPQSSRGKRDQSATNLSAPLQLTSRRMPTNSIFKDQEIDTPLLKQIPKQKQAESLKDLRNEEQKKKLLQRQQSRISVSQRKKLRPIGDFGGKVEKIIKEPLIERKILLKAKQKQVKSQDSGKELKAKIVKINKANLGFESLSSQLVEKFKGLSNSSQQELVWAAKKYWKDNLPQAVDRINFSSQTLGLYQFLNNSPIVVPLQNRIKKRPEMSLKRLSELTGYPQIVSRSTFLFDTLICDEKTTIPFCVISTKMIHGRDQPGKSFQNILLLHDIFDSYIQMISLTKDLLEDCTNKRVILFNLPGQSHTIYDAHTPLRPTETSAIIDKVLYRLSQHQLGVINTSKETIKIVGLGFGAMVGAAYLGRNPAMHSITTSALLVNCPRSRSNGYANMLESLLTLFTSGDLVAQQNAFLFYNRAINSSQTGAEQLQNKSGLNSIRCEGRAYILSNAIKHWDSHSIEQFQNYKGKVWLLYGRNNTIVAKTQMQRLLFFQKNEKEEIGARNLLEVEGGHDLIADNYEGFVKNLTDFFD